MVNKFSHLGDSINSIKESQKGAHGTAVDLRLAVDLKNSKHDYPGFSSILMALVTKRSTLAVSIF